MAPKRQITNKGLELLASSSKATGQHWWLGWYALAFVPDELQEDEKEKLGPNMTKLTENGDIIYNIFQGDMNGDGYQTTRASSKFKSVNYDSNIKKNYRYVLDEDGRNNLVTWVDGKNGLKGACVYPGVKVVSSRENDSIGVEASKIPLPAPLLYTGVKAAGEGWSTDGMNMFLGSGNDRIENFYPVEDVEDVSVDGKKVPRVSADFRNYEGYRNGLTKLNDGEQGYDDALNTAVFNDVDVDGWFPSVNTYTQNGESEVDKDYNKFCRQYWKVLSISNFNKYCAPVNASGLLYDENTGCRNMSKATKYFPISDYSVTSTSKTADNEYATGIKLKVDVKLNGNAEDGAYFKDVEMADSENVATLDPNALESEHALFNTQKVSFKFNRIGIYAVPMRQYGCSDDSGDMKAQYQIDTEAEPVLFAVYEWDSPVTLSDSGEGLSEFQSEVSIDFSTAIEDSSVIRESAVFYNLYEDDAFDWYKNQLVANAAMGEAIINMQIEMGYLRNQKNAKQGCCPKSEEIKSDDKVSTGLRNLVDAKDYNSNSVRNRLAVDEGKAIADVYSDNMPHFGGIGYPQEEPSGHDIFARKATDGQSDSYSAFYGNITYADGIGSLGDAEIDGHVYFDMTPSSNIEGEGYAARFGNLWLRTKLYYEIYSFINQTGKAYDYPEDVESNDYVDAIGTVTDMCGEGRDARGYDMPYITITRTPTEISTTENGITRVGWYPPELDERADFVAEMDLTQNPFSNYESGAEQRTYHVYYVVESDDTRDYSQYMFLRTKKLKLPKVQMYNIIKRYDGDTNFAIPAIRQQLSSTGWRIPTMDDWNAIIANTTDESIDKVRSSSYWTDDEDNPISGGTGSVFPLGGVTRGRGGTSVYNATKAIYLAIDEGDDYTGVPHVVEFDGKKFTIIEKPNFPEFESAVEFVGVLCVADAVKISDGIPKYKLGHDSYALMEGSVSAGDHNLNAGKNSIMMASAHYNAILSGMDNKITDSHYNTVLNGISNELTGAVFSAVAGSNNIIGAKDANPTCRALIVAERTLVYGSVTSAIFAEVSSIERAYQSSIIGRYLNVKEMYDSRVIGQSTTLGQAVSYSDLIAFSSSHLPALHMSRVTFVNDHKDELPSMSDYDDRASVCYSDIIGYQSHFWRKSGDDAKANSVNYSRMSLTSAGIVNIQTAYSEISAIYDGYSSTQMPYLNSWYKDRTLDSVTVNHSRIKLCGSSITSNYIYSGDVRRSEINFMDISLGYSLVQLTESAEGHVQHNLQYGVMKLSESSIALSDCSYVYESGTRHVLHLSNIAYGTLVGRLITLAGGTTEHLHFNNLHIYGSLALAASINNQLILGGLDGTTIGPNENSASSYITEFGSFITGNSKNYPMIWSLGGVGMYMNKMVLGNRGVDGARAPSINDVLTVVGTEDNVATVAWKPGGSGNGANLIIIQDDGVIVPYRGNNQYVTISSANVSAIPQPCVRYSVLQDGEFTVYNNRDDVVAYDHPDMGSEIPLGLRPNGSNKIIWNTWHKILANGIFDGDSEGQAAHIKEIENPEKRLYIVTDNLLEGVVYEVTINIRANARLSDGESIMDVDGTHAGGMLAPGMDDRSFYIYFYNNNGGSVTANRWADSTHSSNHYIRPTFNRVPTENKQVAWGPTAGQSIQAPVLATATAYFVKIDGKIYVMGY